MHERLLARAFADLPTIMPAWHPDSMPTSMRVDHRNAFKLLRQLRDEIRDNPSGVVDGRFCDILDLVFNVSAMSDPEVIEQCRIRELPVIPRQFPSSDFWESISLDEAAETSEALTEIYSHGKRLIVDKTQKGLPKEGVIGTLLVMSMTTTQALLDWAASHQDHSLDEAIAFWAVNVCEQAPNAVWTLEELARFEEGVLQAINWVSDSRVEAVDIKSTSEEIREIDIATMYDSNPFIISVRSTASLLSALGAMWQRGLYVLPLPADPVKLQISKSKPSRYLGLARQVQSVAAEHGNIGPNAF